MRLLLEQIEQSLNHRYYYLSLMATLAIPDIAGALDSDDGRASGARYKAWFEAWVRPMAGEIIQALIPQQMAEILRQVEGGIPGFKSPLTGDACYRFRCSLLHQGSTQDPNSPYDRILFVEPGTSTNVIHYSMANNALIIDVNMFCQEVIAGARLWLDSVEGTDKFESNYSNFARRHPNGFAPFIGGAPVIG
jgi:hypothetical protein